MLSLTDAWHYYSRQAERLQQRLYYRDEEGKYVVFAQTTQYLQELTVEGKSVYMFGTHQNKGADEKLDYLLEVSTVQTLQATLKVMGYHELMYATRHMSTSGLVSRTEALFIGPTGL